MRRVRAFRAAMAAVCAATWPATASAAPIINAANGHYYEFVNNVRLDWFGANAAANATLFMGATGHLATITSAQENLFITSAFGATALSRRWIGGFQPAGSTEPAGGWSWVTGETWGFTNWSALEPNNAFGTENYLSFSGGADNEGATWNDLTGTSREAGYVVEFDIAPVPEPTTVTLVAMGLLGVGAALGRRRSPRVGHSNVPR